MEFGPLSGFGNPTLPGVQDSLYSSDSSGRSRLSSSSGQSHFSDAYNQSATSLHSISDESINSSENEVLKETVADLTNEVDILRMELNQMTGFLGHPEQKSSAEITQLNSLVSQVQAERDLARDMYQQLVAKLGTSGDLFSIKANSTGSNVDAIVTACLQEDRYPLFNAEDFENPNHLMFREVDYKAAKKNTQGVTQVDRSMGKSTEPAFPFLVDKHGTVAAATIVTNMREKARSIWIALKREGRCPTSWLKADSFATEYFYRTMRATYEHFRLCEYDWKARQFAIKSFPQWEDKPTQTDNSTADIKLEDLAITRIKAESARSLSVTPEPSVILKRPLSQVALPANGTKKPRLENLLVTRSASMPTSPALYVPTPDKLKYAHMKIRNVLEENKENDVPAAHPIESATGQLEGSSLLATLASVMKTPIKEAMTTEWMPKALAPEKASATIDPSLGQLDSSSNGKKTRGNPLAALRITKNSYSARNLCKIDYKADVNKGKGRLVTVGEFDRYWDNLSAEQIQLWKEKEASFKQSKGITQADGNQPGPSQIGDNSAHTGFP